MTFDLQSLPAWPQSQESLSAQMAALVQIANRLGLHDAADAVKQMTPKNICINFGANSPRIEEQLKDQGLRLDDPLTRHFLQRDIDDVNRLQGLRILTDAEAGNAFRRIYRIIKLHAKPL